MTNTYTEPNSILEAFENLSAAWKAENYILTRHLLIYICENIPLDELEKLVLKNIRAAIGIAWGIEILPI
ncbi:hypothetical protein QUF70_17760, partial [Desulfobacterales bacterium HSG17]|nr:hypothetical protein [Desulfobacterales bacterium HSG17]